MSYRETVAEEREEGRKSYRDTVAGERKEELCGGDGKQGRGNEARFSGDFWENVFYNYKIELYSFVRLFVCP